jgi:hypothetical protein
VQDFDFPEEEKIRGRLSAPIIFDTQINILQTKKSAGRCIHMFVFAFSYAVLSLSGDFAVISQSHGYHETTTKENCAAIKTPVHMDLSTKRTTVAMLFLLRVCCARTPEVDISYKNSTIKTRYHLEEFDSFN